MPRLCQLTVTQFNQQLWPTGRQVAIRSNQILNTVDSTRTWGYSSLTINKLDGSKPDTLVAASAASAVQTLLNVANTTNSINEISLTVIVDSAGNTATKRVPVAYIHMVQPDPLNIARSYVAIEDTVGQIMSQYHCSQTVAAIVALANA